MKMINILLQFLNKKDVFKYISSRIIFFFHISSNIFLHEKDLIYSILIKIKKLDISLKTKIILNL